MTGVRNFVDNAIRAADAVLEQDAYQRSPGDPWDSWRQKWDATVAAGGDVVELGSFLTHPDRGLEGPVDAGEVTQDGFDAWREAGRAPGKFPSRVRWEDRNGLQHVEKLNYLLQTDSRKSAVEKLAESAFEGKDVVEAIKTIQRMIDSRSSWTASQIQAAVEIAGFDIDVEEHAQPDFHIPSHPD